MNGLTEQEVQDRIEQGLVNEDVDTSTGTVKQIVKENVLTYFNLIFTVLAGLLIAVGSFKDLTFMIIVVINTGIGIFQGIKSKNTLDNLKFDKMPRTRVIRAGRETEVPSDMLVRDDVVLLRAGNAVPADGDILEGEVQVNESMITGESDEITRGPGATLHAGSFVVSGQCAVKLTGVGKDSYINRLTIEATKQKKNDTRSEMVKSLDRMLVVIGVAIIPIGMILFLQQYHYMYQPFRESVISMVAAVLGMLPEGLFMMASGAMIVSTIRLAQKSVLVQNMRCIETLARVDVLCVDKTGTITENEMKVEDLEILTPSADEGKVRLLAGDFCQNLESDNATMDALQKYFNVTSDRHATERCGFSSKYKYSAVSFNGLNLVLGAPEYVLGDSFDRYAERIGELSQLGYRVLAFGAAEEMPRGGEITCMVEPIALIWLHNPIRKTAPVTFRYFARNGVDIKVISGDNADTVSRVALEAGIKNAESYVDARTLRSQEAIDRAVSMYTVFGRVTPEQKRMIVRALQKQGHTVGMTGDGVNDILALRDADTSIAMASGSEAASNAAQLVLLDSDFSHMPSVVAEGRRVVNNIIKTATLYLTKNIFSLLLAIFSMVSVLQYPLKPSQITLISIFTIGLPSFVLSFEPNKDRITGSFLGKVFRMAAPAGITIFLSVSGLLIFSQIMEVDQESVSTAASGLVALGEFLILARVAKPMNRTHLIMMLVMVGGFFYMLIFHNSFFGLSPMNWKCVMLLIVFLIVTEAVFRYFYKMTAFLGVVLNKDKRTAWIAEQREARRRAHEDAESAGTDGRGSEPAQGAQREKEEPYESGNEEKDQRTPAYLPGGYETESEARPGAPAGSEGFGAGDGKGLGREEAPGPADRR